MILDALILSSGLFAWLAAAAVALVGAGVIGGDSAATAGSTPGGGAAGAVAMGLGPLVLMAGSVLGPLAAWLLHGRRITWAAVIGAVVGCVILGPLVAIAAPLLATVLGFALSPLTSWEYAGPVALAVLVGAGFVAAVLAGMVLGARDRAQQRWLGRLRWAGFLGMVVLAVTTVVALRGGADPELGDAGVFAMVIGMGAAAATAGADLAVRLVGNRPAAASGNGAAQPTQ